MSPEKENNTPSIRPQEKVDKLYELSQLEDGETPELYKEKLFEIYPKEYQKAYIEGMMAIAKTSIYGISALESYQYNRPCEPEVLEMYPKAYNTHVLKYLREGKCRVSIPLTMHNKEANTLYKACNNASYWIKQIEEKIVNNKINNLLLDVLLEITIKEQTNLSFSLKSMYKNAKANVKKIVEGDENMLRNADEQIKKIVNADTLHLDTQKAWLLFAQIRDISIEPIRNIYPFNIYNELVILSLAARNLGIYIYDHEDFFTVYRDSITSPQ